MSVWQLVNSMVVAIVLMLGAVGCDDHIPASGPKLKVSQNKQERMIKEHHGVLVKGESSLWVQGRQHDLPDCRVCHAGQGEIQHGDGRQSHYDVQLKHSEAMNCATCHDDENPEQLKLGEKRVNLDHSYQLCATCHFQQFDDFKIGAHGKRMTGWAFPRIVKNCVECHAPHSPHFKAEATVARPMILPPRLQGHHHE